MASFRWHGERFTLGLPGLPRLSFLYRVLAERIE
jgi:hypothetical protein